VPGEVQKPEREGIEAALGAAKAYRLDIKAKQLFLGGNLPLHARCLPKSLTIRLGL
jgi:hypothetical protein